MSLQLFPYKILIKNIFYIYLFELVFLFSLEKYPKVELLGCMVVLFLIFFKDFIYIFLERGEGKEKEKERTINVWLPLMLPFLGI